MSRFSLLSRNLVSIAGALVFAGVCVTGAIAPAEAATSNTKVATAEVHYADLDLTDPGARATLDRRIKAAARTVCASNGRELMHRSDEMRCIREAIAGAARS